MVSCLEILSIKTITTHSLTFTRLHWHSSKRIVYFNNREFFLNTHLVYYYARFSSRTLMNGTDNIPALWYLQSGKEERKTYIQLIVTQMMSYKPNEAIYKLQ